MITPFDCSDRSINPLETVEGDNGLVTALPGSDTASASAAPMSLLSRGDFVPTGHSSQTDSHGAARLSGPLDWPPTCRSRLEISGP